MQNRNYVVAFWFESEVSRQGTWQRAMDQFDNQAQLGENTWLLQSMDDIDSVYGTLRKVLTDPADSIFVIEADPYNCRHHGPVDSKLTGWYRRNYR